MHVQACMLRGGWDEVILRELAFWGSCLSCTAELQKLATPECSSERRVGLQAQQLGQGRTREEQLTNGVGGIYLIGKEAAIGRSRLRGCEAVEAVISG